MRSLVFLLALTLPAAAGPLDAVKRALWPSHYRQAEPAPMPAERPAIAPAKPPVAAAPPAHRIKPKWKPAPARKRMAAPVPSWCGRVPAGTTMAQVEGFAALQGVTMTPRYRRQAEACLRSKR